MLYLQITELTLSIVAIVLLTYTITIFFRINYLYYLDHSRDYSDDMLRLFKKYRIAFPAWALLLCTATSIRIYRYIVIEGIPKNYIKNIEMYIIIVIATIILIASFFIIKKQKLQILRYKEFFENEKEVIKIKQSQYEDHYSK